MIGNKYLLINEKYCGCLLFVKEYLMSKLVTQEKKTVPSHFFWSD